jgi:integrase
MLEKYMNKPAHTIGKRQVDNFVAICQETISGRTTKERCWLIQSCWDWAKDKYHLASDNPWVDAAVRFQILPRQQVKPFTIAELQAIRSVISSHPQYRYYPSFITLRTVKSFAITISFIQRAIANDFTVSFNFQPCPG